MRSKSHNYEKISNYDEIMYNGPVGLLPPYCLQLCPKPDYIASERYLLAYGLAWLLQPIEVTVLV